MLAYFAKEQKISESELNEIIEIIKSTKKNDTLYPACCFAHFSMPVFYRYFSKGKLFIIEQVGGC